VSRPRQLRAAPRPRRSWPWWARARGLGRRRWTECVLGTGQMEASAWCCGLGIDVGQEALELREVRLGLCCWGSEGTGTAVRCSGDGRFGCGGG